jgi:putative ABC transport system substrate-binding protein
LVCPALPVVRLDGARPTIGWPGSTSTPSDTLRLKVDLIVAYGSAGATLKQATASIPIVLAPALDPVGLGLVASLSHPGGNVTALSLQASDAAGKRLELLRDTVPKLGRLGILFDGGTAAAVQEKSEVQAVARTLGLEVVPLEIRRAEDIASAFDALKGKADALYVTETSLTFTNGTTITRLALNARLPTIFTNAETVRAGALMSYGPDFPALFRRAAEIVDKIQRGTKAGDIPVEQPTKFYLVINLKTANALGLTIPHNLLVLADDVIE